MRMIFERKMSMGKGRKIAISLLVDFLLLGVVVCCVYMLITGDMSSVYMNIYKALIIICIPSTFLVTYINTSWDKYDEEELGEKFDDEADTDFSGDAPEDNPSDNMDENKK